MSIDTTISGGWEAAYRDNSAGVLWDEQPMPVVENVARRARERGLRVGVDLGCGEGRNLLALRQAGLELAGLDISPTALGRADLLLRAAGECAALIEGDICALPLASGTIDLVTALDVAGQVPEPAIMIAEAHRVLRSDGLFVVNLFSLEDETYGQGEEVGRHTFRYKDTLFRYFEEDGVRSLFEADWEVEIEKLSWVDEPHGDFRATRHRHVNHIVWAVPR
jgi:SAM-dependent methyltransferase